MMQKFSDLDSFLLNVPKTKALGVQLSMLGMEFDLSRDEAIKALQERGFYLAEQTGWLLIARTEKVIDATINGAKYLEMRSM